MHRGVLRTWLWTEGRGPKLRRVHYTGTRAPHPVRLRALDYLNPNWGSDVEIRHLEFNQARVWMFTSEEVHNYGRDGISWGAAIDHAAAVNLGKSEWLLSFAQQHLDRCNHYRIMFYDEFLDVICESVGACRGPLSEVFRISE